jgi:phosphonate transport system permease protein
MHAREVEVRRLWRERPRSRFARLSLAALLALGVYAWLAGDFSWSDLVAPRRRANLERFLGELRPYPLQGRPFAAGVALAWAGDLLERTGLEAAATTLAISVAAIALAALLGAALALPAARNWAAAEPFLPAARPRPWPVRLGWGALVYGTRALLIFLRSIPEYLWAFLGIALIGPTAWPAVLALAAHNAGILGKLDAEVVENLERPSLEALSGLGARRGHIAAFGILPVVLPRLLLFFFYRWETCVREATVLGMLGIVSLGYFIQDARARNQYDTMFFLVLIGAAIVLLGDLVSALARRIVRRA